MATVIQGNQIVFAIVEQTDVDSGVPSTPTFEIMRRVDGNLTDTPAFTPSNEVDSTRQGAENILISQAIDGTFNGELSIADPVYHMFIEGTLQGRFGTETDYTASTLSFVNGTSTIDDTADLAFADMEVGQFFGVTGSTDNDRIFRITAKTDAGTVTVAPAPVDESAGASITLKGKMARSGKEEIGYTIQKRTPTTSGTQYETFENVQFTALSNALTTDSIFTTSQSVIGTDKRDGLTAISGQTDNTNAYERILGSVNGVPYVWLDNVPTLTKDVLATDITIDIDNGSQGLSVLNKLGAGAIMHDRINVTGTYSTYADKASPLAEKVKATSSTMFSLALEFEDTNGNKMVVTRDSTMYTTLDQTDTANGTAVMNDGTVSSDGKQNAYLTTIQFDYIEA